MEISRPSKMPAKAGFLSFIVAAPVV